MKKWKSYEETIEDLKKTFSKRAKCEYVNLLDAHGRVLAQDLIAKQSCPEYPTSSMDGYAFKYEDQDLGELKIISFVPAGTDTSVSVGKGECVKTFTGSLMSDGSDTLIPIENVEVKGDKIIIKEKVSKNFSVRPIGEAYFKGDVLIKKGTTITYREIGVIAEQGLVQVPVLIKPRVAILSTGDEVVDIGEPITRDSQIRSSSHMILACICKEVGAEPIVLGVAKDDKEFIKRRVIEGLEVADIVLTTGGVSVGDYDFVKDVVNEVGVEMVVEGSAIKPGRHIRVVKAGEKYIIALPGFPYSTIVGFYLYGVRLIEHWLYKDFDRRCGEAIIDEDYKKRSRFKEFTACNLKEVGDSLHVDLEGKVKGSSAIITNLLNKAVLLCVDVDKQLTKKGEKVTFLKLHD